MDMRFAHKKATLPRQDLNAMIVGVKEVTFGHDWVLEWQRVVCFFAERKRVAQTNI
jgi:hypothetical protein